MKKIKFFNQSCAASNAAVWGSGTGIALTGGLIAGEVLSPGAGFVVGFGGGTFTGVIAGLLFLRLCGDCEEDTRRVDRKSVV